MKPIAISVLLLVFLIASAEAGISLKLKNGNTMEWSNLTEEADQYCTKKSSGKFCIPKNVVVSIAQEEENPDAVVIVNKSSGAEKDTANKDAECQRLWAEVEKYKPGETDTTISGLINNAQRKGLLSDALKMYKTKCQKPEQHQTEEVNERLDKMERKLKNSGGTKVKQIYDAQTGQMKTCYDYGYTVNCY